MSLPKKIAFVDLETTGMRSTYDRIIEIGILRIEDNKVVKSFHSLINPLYHIPPEIISLTGITPQELEKAPTFREIKDEILEVLEGATFVAHNVRFDYSFLKNEFKRFNTSFSPKHFCTVKLSRTLFPKFKNHDLSSIIERFNLECQNRHRAFDDAKVLWDFYQKLQLSIPENLLQKAVDICLKKPSLPIKLPIKDLEALPESPGVYIFYGENGAPLYVGKSISIRDRVMSHFSSDHSSSKEMKISQQIESIETIKTSGELGALLLEASLIKKLQPIYNRTLRHSRVMTVVKETKNIDGYLSVEIDNLDNLEIKELNQVLGVFKSVKTAKQFLIKAAKDHQLCEKLLGIEATKGGCFGYRLGRCNGGCVKKEIFQKYNLRFIEAFSNAKIKPWPFEGPIVIEEENPLEETKEKFVINHWCYLGNIKADNLFPELSQQPFFDVDSYKILARFFKSAKNLKSIKKLSANEAKQYGLI